jgi:hypothetical protein
LPNNENLLIWETSRYCELENFTTFNEHYVL